MRRLLIVLTIAILLSIAAVPAAAQAGLRVPISLDTTQTDTAANAYPFHPDIEFEVSDVETATTEGSEPTHICGGLSAGYSLWFYTNLEPGTITLDTAGTSYDLGATPSPDSVISLYRLNGSFDFANLTPLACSDNGSGSGILDNFVIGSTGAYYVQISAAQGVIPVDPSKVKLKVSYTPNIPVSNDEPANARKLKMPGLPTTVGTNSATTSFDEPFDPLVAITITNTVWYKFTMSSRRVIGFQSLYAGVGLRFSLFTRSGDIYTPANGVNYSDSNILTAILDPGEYYLRAGVFTDLAGTTSSFFTFSVITYLMPANYEFSVAETEGTIVAQPDLQGWTVKSNTAGDGAICENVPDYECYFQFTSDGAGEKTQLKSKINLSGIKLKKGDAIVPQLFLLNLTTAPNLLVTVAFTDAAGTTQKYSYTITDTLNDKPGIVVPTTKTITPVKVQISVKNKNTVLGQVTQIDGVVVYALRLGEGQRMDGFALTQPSGVLAVPPPAN